MTNVTSFEICRAFGSFFKDKNFDLRVWKTGPNMCVFSLLKPRREEFGYPEIMATLNLEDKTCNYQLKFKPLPDDGYDLETKVFLANEELVKETIIPIVNGILNENFNIQEFNFTLDAI